MQQAINSFFQLDKSSIVGEITYLARNHFVDRILVENSFPWIILGLLHPKRQLLPLRINTQNNNFDLIPNAN